MFVKVTPLLLLFFAVVTNADVGIAVEKNPTPSENPSPKMQVVVPHPGEFDTASLQSIDDLNQICKTVTKRIESALDFAAQKGVYILDTELMLLQTAFHACRTVMNNYEFYYYQIEYKEGRNPVISSQNNDGKN